MNYAVAEIQEISMRAWKYLGATKQVQINVMVGVADTPNPMIRWFPVSLCRYFVGLGWIEKRDFATN